MLTSNNSIAVVNHSAVRQINCCDRSGSNTEGTIAGLVLDFMLFALRSCALTSKLCCYNLMYSVMDLPLSSMCRCRNVHHAIKTGLQSNPIHIIPEAKDSQRASFVCCLASGADFLTERHVNPGHTESKS